MQLDPTQRSRLADAARDRQREIGKNQREVAARAGISLAVYNKIVTCRAESVSVGTLDALDTGLGWPRGTSEKIVKGERPPGPVRLTVEDIAEQMARDPAVRRVLSKILTVEPAKRGVLLEVFERMVDVVA